MTTNDRTLTVIPLRKQEPALERMSQLAESFPTLRGSFGVRPWDALLLLSLPRTGWGGHGARCALAFVLSVWNPSTDWGREKISLRGKLVRSGVLRFDVHEALGTWDEPHRAAFLAWCRYPWWP